MPSRNDSIVALRSQPRWLRKYHAIDWNRYRGWNTDLLLRLLCGWTASSSDSTAAAAATWQLCR